MERERKRKRERKKERERWREREHHLKIVDPHCSRVIRVQIES